MIKLINIKSLRPLFSQEVQSLSQIKRRQYPLVDLVRGCIVISMVTWHLMYFLSIFNYLTPYYYASPDMQIWRYAIIYPFMYLFGLSISLAYENQGFYRRYFERTVRLGLTAAIVSVVTWFIFGASWVYSGIFHFFTVASIIVLPVARFKLLALLVGLVIAVAYYQYEMLIPWIEYEGHSFEFFSLSPGLAWIFFGMASHSLGLHRFAKGWQSNNFFYKSVLYLGQHSILAYLIHLPILYLVFSVLSVFLPEYSMRYFCGVCA